VNEETVSDTHGRGMRASGDARLPNDAGQLVAHGLGVFWPEELAGVVAGLSADVMHLFKKADEGVGDRDRSADCRAFEENGSAAKVDLRGCQSFRFRQIAARVMEQIAKCPGWALLPVSGHKKSAAFLVIEEKASSILVKQAYCRHFLPIE
jgi:hypothetical protein